eukprot:6173519-Pleurochrysis_carterae.AAC.6
MQHRPRRAVAAGATPPPLSRDRAASKQGAQTCAARGCSPTSKPAASIGTVASAALHTGFLQRHTIMPVAHDASAIKGPAAYAH